MGFDKPEPFTGDSMVLFIGDFMAWFCLNMGVNVASANQPPFAMKPGTPVPITGLSRLLV